MTAALKIRGVPYSTMDDVESAVLKLAADATLLDEEDESTDDYARHIGELLAALPDDRALDLLAQITPGGLPESSLEDSASHGGERGDETGRAGIPQAAALPLCPMCNGEGILAVEPPQDPTAQRCPACNGYGKVYTGSRVEGNTTRDCPTCNGGGFIDRMPDIPLPPPAVRAAPAPTWPGATWNAISQRWDAPGTDAPWEGATWDGLEGKYV